MARLPGSTPINHIVSVSAYTYTDTVVAMFLQVTACLHHHDAVFMVFKFVATLFDRQIKCVRCPRVGDFGHHLSDFGLSSNFWNVLDAYISCRHPHSSTDPIKIFVVMFEN